LHDELDDAPPEGTLDDVVDWHDELVLPDPPLDTDELVDPVPGMIAPGGRLVPDTPLDPVLIVDTPLIDAPDRLIAPAELLVSALSETAVALASIAMNALDGELPGSAVAPEPAVA
jgi:hypothetical protein